MVKKLTQKRSLFVGRWDPRQRVKTDNIRIEQHNKMGRDSGKGKGGGRGKGRKMFIENMDELTIREKEVSEQRDARAR